MRFYVYKTTCLPTGKYYYGVHSERRSSDGYIGNGVCSNGTARALKRKGAKSMFIDAVIKYGYHNFRKDILKYTDTAEDAFEIEELIVDESEVNNPMCMNLRLGGEGGRLEARCKKVTIIDCETGDEHSFDSQADCAHFLGLKNISGKKRFLSSRYVRKEFAEPVSLKTIDGKRYDFKDIFQCCSFFGIKSPSKIRAVLNGDRHSTNGLFRVDFDFSSDNYWGAKSYKKNQSLKTDRYVQ